CIAGNHDWAAVGKLDISDFNPYAARACLWTRRRLSPEAVCYLENLPLRLCCAEFTLVHGSPHDPIWEYVVSTRSAQTNFGRFSTRFCLVGHSHLPLMFAHVSAETAPSLKELPSLISIKRGQRRLIINPGSVGQPRDGDPRASYILYHADEAGLHHYRVPYDIAATQQKMLQRGLPHSLAARLGYGC
ncbi:metallophosphoesterase family protein, partial [Chloroflexota bacterium]